MITPPLLAVDQLLKPFAHTVGFKELSRPAWSGGATPATIGHWGSVSCLRGGTFWHTGCIPCVGDNLCSSNALFDLPNVSRADRTGELTSAVIWAGCARLPEGRVVVENWKRDTQNSTKTGETKHGIEVENGPCTRFFQFLKVLVWHHLYQRCYSV